ncbi:FERM domain-containing protein 5-like [Diadema antillarum]|uniref:FERM domain-containing protein 5-like n=1 Tax=Diadema antillarum TaxID=105358 RepID=UPI003A84E8C3
MEHRYHCIIKLLDEQVESINVEFQKDSKGQYLLDQACDALRLAEREYFGLRFVDHRKQRHWLDCKKNALKQMKGIGPPYKVVFRFKFYPGDPYTLKEEITRYQLFQQLKRDLLHGRLVCSFQEEAMLGACIVQSNLEDYNPEEHLPGYVSYYAMFPKQTQKLQIRVEELHQTALRGLEPAQAEFKFIETSHKLDTYGVDPHLVRDMYGTQLYIGLTFRGVLLFRGSMLLQTFKWDTVRKFSQEGRAVIVHAVSHEKKVNHRYWLASETAAEHLWKCAIENQGFYQNKVTKGLKRSNSFLRRNRYSFSGSTQMEALENSTHLERKEPKVARSPPLIRPRRSLHIDNPRPMSDASTFEGFSAHMASQNHSTPVRELDILPPMFSLASVDTEDDTSSTDTQPQQQTTVGSAGTVVTDGQNPVWDPLPNLVEEEEVTETKGHTEASESDAQAKLGQMTCEESNKQLDGSLAKMSQKPFDRKEGEIPSSSAYSMILLFLLVTLTTLLVIFLLFETDLPLVQPVQDLQPVSDLRHVYYEPAKSWIVDRWQVIHNDFIAPARQYLMGQVETLMRHFSN